MYRCRRCSICRQRNRWWHIKIQLFSTHTAKYIQLLFANKQTNAKNLSFKIDGAAAVVVVVVDECVVDDDDDDDDV
jgi:hypothetical protein